MTQQEFERIAGYEVSSKDYFDFIEPMYMGLKDVDKWDFAKMVSKERFALPTKKELEANMKKLAKKILCMCNTTTHHDEDEKLKSLIDAYSDRTGCEFYVKDEQSKGGCYYPAELWCYSSFGSFKYMTLAKED